MPRVIVKCRLFFDDSVEIGNGDKDFKTPPGIASAKVKLIQIARIIVVYRTPDKIAQITGLFFSPCCGPVDSVEFGEGVGREIGKKSPFNHRPVGDGL